MRKKLLNPYTKILTAFCLWSNIIFSTIPLVSSSKSPSLKKNQKCVIHKFIPCHRKYSQSEYRKAVVYSTVFNPTFPSCAAILFSMKFSKHIFYGSGNYYGISHESLVFSSYTHSPKGSCVYRENTSDSWDIHSLPLESVA